MRHLLPLAVLAVALVAAERPEDKKSDKDRLQGTWVVSGVEAKGEALKSGDMFESLKDMKLTFKDDTVINSKHADDKCIFKIDAGKKPATLDVEVTGTKKETMLMLYQFKDDNTLQLCGVKNHERPKDFSSNDDQMIITLKRQEK
jgi:uncharacterized protein (TIGR03067 family)